MDSFQLKNFEKVLENGTKYWESERKAREFRQSGKVGTTYRSPLHNKHHRIGKNTSFIK